MTVDVGEYVHVVERRRFESDLRRHFLGRVDRADGITIRASGYTFVYDHGRTAYVRSDRQRTRIFGLNAGGLIVNVVTPDTNLDDVRYQEVGGRLVVTDGASLLLDINEFGPNR